MTQWVKPHAVEPDHVQPQEPRCWRKAWTSPSAFVLWHAGPPHTQHMVMLKLARHRIVWKYS